jgi:hypothetical protein
MPRSTGARASVLRVLAQAHRPLLTSQIAQLAQISHHKTWQILQDLRATSWIETRSIRYSVHVHQATAAGKTAITSYLSDLLLREIDELTAAGRVPEAHARTYATIAVSYQLGEPLASLADRYGIEYVRAALRVLNIPLRVLDIPPHPMPAHSGGERHP